MPSMLRTSFRILALSLLVLAIPVQGMASIVAGQCMMFGHHQDAGAQDHAHEHGDADQHDHGARSQPDEDNSAHCGPCAACCASATMAAGTWPSLSSAPSLAKYEFTQFSPLAVQPLGPDRPPLSI